MALAMEEETEEVVEAMAEVETAVMAEAMAGRTGAPRCTCPMHRPDHQPHSSPTCSRRWRRRRHKGMQHGMQYEHRCTMRPSQHTRRMQTAVRHRSRWAADPTAHRKSRQVSSLLHH